MYLLQDSDRLGLTGKKNPKCDVGFSQIFSPVILSFHLFSYIFTQGYNSYMMGVEQETLFLISCLQNSKRQQFPFFLNIPCPIIYLLNITRHFPVWISVKPITTTAYPGFIIDEVKEASEEEDLDQDEDEDKIEYSNSSGWGRTTSADDNILRNILSRGKRERTISEVQNTKHSLAVPSNATNKAFIKRNVSTPGFGRLARLDSVQEREVQQILSGSSALVYEVQVYENINFPLLLLLFLF